MAKIIVLGAMKGGVGKSVSTYNLAYSLKKLGKNVLVVDFDSSANITRCVVEDIKTVTISIGDLMMNQMDEGEQPNPAEYIINRNGVDFIPSSKVLSAVDAKLRLEMGAEKILACILEPFRDEYDYILIDTCPSLNTLTINALSAADEVIIWKMWSVMMEGYMGCSSSMVPTVPEDGRGDSFSCRIFHRTTCRIWKRQEHL